MKALLCSKGKIYILLQTKEGKNNMADVIKNVNYVSKNK
jgi:hypothetical protein